MSSFFEYIHSSLIKPLSRDRDQARREFILNVLLSGILLLSILAFLLNVYYLFSLGSEYRGAPIFLTFGITVIIAFLLYASRKGRIRLSGIVLNVLLFLVSYDIGTKSGVENPQFLLLSAIVIVMSGILVGTRFALLMTFLISFNVITLMFLQIVGLLNPIYYWREENLRVGEGIIFVVFLNILSLISWLFNTEINKSLDRARRSERALRRQRDRLEVLVEKRTEQLRKEQEKLLIEEHRFANFGRHTVGLLHDLSNPLTIVALNLEQLEKNASKKEFQRLRIALERAMRGTKTMERYVLAARMQLSGKNENKHFSPTTEISHVLEILSPKAKKDNIILQMVNADSIVLTGNASHFSQVMMNLVSNAIDAYAKSKTKKKEVIVKIVKEEKELKTTVTDFGIGIPEENINKIFKPLFTTKKPQEGTGIGLSLSKEIITESFGGSIDVVSRKGYGSTFTVHIPFDGKNNTDSNTNT